MNKFRRVILVIAAVELLLLLLFNGLWHYKGLESGEKLYLVEAERIAKELKDIPPEEIDLSAYTTIQEVNAFDPQVSCNYEYVVKEAGGRLYRIAYEQTDGREILFYGNCCLLLCFVGSMGLLLYLDRKILRPFYRMSELPSQLAKGNLSVPILEEKSRFFGKFLWGMDMLRDKLESDREKELSLQKEKKEMVLSLTHDIKTPLSAIRLYTKALSANLYDTQEKRQSALLGIERNISAVEEYVNEITRASREDFLHLEVTAGEFYLSEVMDAIGNYYRDKLELLHIQFQTPKAADSLLRGDQERVVEVLQNIMENAIKYGDGKRISLTAGEEEDCRLVVIENSGCSLKEEELPHIFDSFYRGSNTENIKGSGLGLYICKNLMKQMDGDVFAKCREDGFAVTVVLRKA